MKRLWNCCLICLLAIAGTNSASARLENRYLFILETSKEMKREAEPAKNVLLQLIYSGVIGQMKAGDTFGVWTYNDKLHADLPMQSFAGEDRDRVTQRTKEYLETVKFTGGAHLETALLPMLKLVTNSPNLTVILISDGKQAVVGTPFDQEIRALHKKYSDELREAKLPFITVLVANKGEFISYAVNSALGPIRVPRLPAPPEPAKVAQPIVEKPKPVVKRAAEPLILKGPLPKKNSTESVPSPAPVAAAATNTVTPASTNAVTAPPTATEVVKTPQVETNKTVEVVAAPTAPPQAPVTTTTNQTVVKAPEPTPTKAPEVTIQTAPPTETPKPVAATPPAPTVQSATIPTKEQTSNVATFTVKDPETNTAKATPPAAVESVKESASTTPPEVPKEEPAVEPKTSSASPAMVAQTETPLNLRNILIGIGAILFLILVVLVMILRKARKVHSSLITQSIDTSVKR